MLTLDTKKIRKGRPIGLPYIGSKKKVSKAIVEIIKQNFGTDKKVYDVFAGGGAITAECLLNGLDVHYNDKDKIILDCFVKVINSDRDYLKTLLISREEFLTIKAKQTKTVDDHLNLNGVAFVDDSLVHDIHISLGEPIEGGGVTFHYGLLMTE